MNILYLNFDTTYYKTLKYSTRSASTEFLGIFRRTPKQHRAIQTRQRPSIHTGTNQLRRELRPKHRRLHGSIQWHLPIFGDNIGHRKTKGNKNRIQKHSYKIS